MLTDPGLSTPDAVPPELAVGAYRFDRASGRLTCRAGAVVPLGRRARAILSVLAEQAGRDVPASQLLDRVWPGQIVDPANVAVQVSGLRAAIGDSDGSVILTVHGRGYRLAVPATPQPWGNIPAALSPLAGRDVELANAARLVRRDRLLVVTGLSGTGKTRLACAAARALAADFPDGQWLVPLGGSAPAGAEGLASRVAAAMGLGLGGEPAAGLRDALAPRSCLLLLDGAEMLDEGALGLVRRLVADCPGVGVLATSHVAHRVMEPWCVRLSPLPVPDGTAATAPAARLFLETARAAGLELGDAEAAPAIAGICRHLGGLPLGVEIAARAASLLGLRAAADASRDPLRALPGIPRPGPARHQSVGAAMGWSLGLLSAAERDALRALSALPGDFTAREARATLARAGAGRPGGWLGNLQRKSVLDRDGDRLGLNPLVRAGALLAA